MGISESSHPLEEVIVDNRLNRTLPSGDTLLTACIRENCFQAIKHLLERNADVNGCNKYGETPLLTALRKHGTETVKILVQQNGIDVNKVGRFGVSPLQVAVLSENTELVELLLSYGANPDGVPLAKQYKYATPLQLSISNLKMSKLLIGNGASVNIGCPLHEAVRTRSAAVALEILNSNSLDINLLNEHEFDILSAAARMHNCELMKCLIKKGILVRKCDKERYKEETGPLGYVIHYGCWDCFQFLLNYVEDIDQEDNFKFTMLQYALISSGWKCSSIKDEDIESCTHEMCMKQGYFLGTECHLTNMNYNINSLRLDYAKELLKRGADLTSLWYRNAVWIIGQKNKRKTDALHFCIRSYHCSNRKKLQSIFRSDACCYDMHSLALVYMDGYYPTEEDILIVENKLKAQANPNSPYDNTPFSRMNLDVLRSSPRSLKSLCVVKIRDVIGPNVYRPVQSLPVPEPMKRTVLLEDTRGMIPVLEHTNNLNDK